jgi:hypothetical protein
MGDREAKQRRVEEAKQRFLATMRELLPPEDLRDIAAAARAAHREDFPEDFPDESTNTSPTSGGRHD